jgi:hypothetical protein
MPNARKSNSKEDRRPRETSGCPEAEQPPPPPEEEEYNMMLATPGVAVVVTPLVVLAPGAPKLALPIMLERIIEKSRLLSENLVPGSGMEIVLGLKSPLSQVRVPAVFSKSLSATEARPSTVV